MTIIEFVNKYLKRGLNLVEEYDGQDNYIINGLGGVFFVIVSNQVFRIEVTEHELL